MHSRRSLQQACWAILGVMALGASSVCHAARPLADGPPSLQPVTEPGQARSVLWNSPGDASRWSVGVAVGQRPLPTGQVWSPNPLTGSSISGAQSSGEASMVLGLGLTTPRAGAVSPARLIWQAPLTQRAEGGDAALAAQGDAVSSSGVPQRMRVGLVLTPADPLAELRGGVLTKVQLSGHMALSLRPRAGGVWLSLNGKW